MHHYGRNLLLQILFHNCIRSLYSLELLKDPIRGVNLGGWLVTEKWICPSLFDELVEKELLDGAKLQFQSTSTKLWLSAVNGGGSTVRGNAEKVGFWETFVLWKEPEGLFQFKSADGHFLSVLNGTLLATAVRPENATLFSIVRGQPANLVHVISKDGLYLQAGRRDGVVTANKTDSSPGWDEAPFVFHLVADPVMQGDFALCNGLGPRRAEEVLESHWSSFITEKDFAFISEAGLNSLRVPIGWWLAFDPSPPWPYASGSRKYLDKAFDWAEKYGLKIMIDLHAVPGSCNGWDLGGSRDGSTLWPLKENVDKTLQVVDILTQRYGSHPALLGIQLLNEPRSYVDASIIQQFFADSYKIVRRNAPRAVVLLSNYIDGNPFAFVNLVHSPSLWPNAMIDVGHWYSPFWAWGQKHKPQWYVNFTRDHFIPTVAYLQLQYTIPIIVGEFSLDLSSSSTPPSSQDFRDFAQAEVEAWSGAQGGWFFFTYRRKIGEWGEDPWSFKKSAENGWINSTMWSSSAHDSSHFASVE